MEETKDQQESKTAARTFTVDLVHLSRKAHSATSSAFAKMDRQYIHNFADRKDMMRQYRDIPVALGHLYKDCDYIKNRHGNDL